MKKTDDGAKGSKAKIDPGMVGRLAGPEAAFLAGRSIGAALRADADGAIPYEEFSQILARPELAELSSKAGVVAEGMFKRGIQTMWLCEKMRSAGLLSSQDYGVYRATDLGRALAAEWGAEVEADSAAHAKRLAERAELLAAQAQAKLPVHGPSLLTRLHDLREAARAGKVAIPDAPKPKMR